MKNGDLASDIEYERRQFHALSIKKRIDHRLIFKAGVNTDKDWRTDCTIRNRRRLQHQCNHHSRKCREAERDKQRSDYCRRCTPSCSTFKECTEQPCNDDRLYTPVRRDARKRGTYRIYSPTFFSNMK